MNLMQKVGTVLGTGAFVASMMTPSAFAAGVNVVGNGSWSWNNVGVVNTSQVTHTQTNNQVVSTNVNSKANTGHNSASFNTGGSNSINTGPATSGVTVVVTGGTNTMAANPCNCNVPMGDVTVAGNGAGSKNGVWVTNVSSTTTTQTNNSVVSTNVKSTANTGGNTSSFNTGGGCGQCGTGGSTSVTAGPAESAVVVSVGGSTNTQ